SDKAPDWLMMEDSTTATAVILDALVRLDAHNPLILGSVRWLLSQRVDGAWDGTQSTALALRALVDYAAHTQPLSGTSRFSRVVLTLTAPQDLYYLAIEDPLPAGAEPVDPTLRTTSVLSGITSQTTIPKGTTDLGWYVSHVELRDDRAAIFADYLPAGTYQYS